jgi:hypothetical protein
MTDGLNESSRSYIPPRIAELEAEIEGLDKKIEDASAISRALGAVGLGKVPRYKELRATRRIILLGLEEHFGIGPWNTPDQP